MRPIGFKMQNAVYAKDQPEYIPLPVYKHNDSMLCVSSCWRMSLVERVKVLFTGVVWLTMPTFGKPLTPAILEIEFNRRTDKG